LKLREHVAMVKDRERCAAYIPETETKSSYNSATGKNESYDVPYEQGKKEKARFLKFAEYEAKAQEKLLASLEPHWCQRHGCQSNVTDFSVARKRISDAREGFSTWSDRIPDVVYQVSTADAHMIKAEQFSANPAGNESRNLFLAGEYLKKANDNLAQARGQWGMHKSNACREVLR
ncbi:MAG: hypothetical protein ABIJ96_16650, partial [Elusimicrobiota bacterium]